MKDALFYLFLADCSSCKNESFCMKNKTMCSFIGGTGPNGYERKRDVCQDSRETQNG